MICFTSAMSEGDGFLVQSRWGIKLHKAGCPCGVCKSRRKAVSDSLQPSNASKRPDPLPDSELHVPGTASSEFTDSPVQITQKQGQLPNGAKTAPAAMRTMRGQAVLNSAVKPVLKVMLQTLHSDFIASSCQNSYVLNLVAIASNVIACCACV